MKRSAFSFLSEYTELGADVLQMVLIAGAGERLGSVARSVVGHDALDFDAEALVLGDGGEKEGHRVLFSLGRMSMWAMRE